MANQARRYNDENKLNYKKIFAVLIFIIVVIMFVVGIKKLITTGMTSTGRITAVSYFPVYSNGKWGIINSDGKVIIEPQYDEMPVVPDSSQSLFVCTYDVDYQAGTYKTKVVNEKNDSIITGYDSVNFIDNIDENGNIYYVNNVLIVQKDGKYGLVNLKGSKVLDAEYDEISILSGVDNSLIIRKDNNIGLCDYSGNIIITPEYKDIIAIGNDYKNGYITVNHNGLYGIIDFNKAVILDNQYLDIKPIYSSNKYAVKIDEGYRIIDKSGKPIVNKSFEDIKDINNDNIIFKQNGKFGITNVNLEDKVKAQFDDLIFMSNNNYIAQDNGLYGVIDINNEVQIDFTYLNIDNNTKAGVVIAKNEQDKYDLYDSTMSLRLTVDDIQIDEEYMTVLIGQEYKYYNFKFEEIDAKTIFSTNAILADEKDGKYGFVSSNGKAVVDYKYDDVTELNKYGFAGIKQNGLWGAINAKGEIIIEPYYNLDNYPTIDFIGEWHKGIGADYYTDM